MSEMGFPVFSNCSSFFAYSCSLRFLSWEVARSKLAFSSFLRDSASMALDCVSSSYSSSYLACNSLRSVSIELSLWSSSTLFSSMSTFTRSSCRTDSRLFVCNIFLNAAPFFPLNFLRTSEQIIRSLFSILLLLILNDSPGIKAFNRSTYVSGCAASTFQSLRISYGISIVKKISSLETDSELYYDIKLAGVRRTYHLLMGLQRDHIALSQSPISGFNHVRVPVRCAAFLWTKAGKIRPLIWRHYGHLSQRRPSSKVGCRHFQKNEKLLREASLKIAFRTVRTGFIRKCVGLIGGEIHAKKQSGGSCSVQAGKILWELVRIIFVIDADIL